MKWENWLGLRIFQMKMSEKELRIRWKRSSLRTEAVWTEILDLTCQLHVGRREKIRNNLISVEVHVSVEPTGPGLRMDVSRTRGWMFSIHPRQLIMNVTMVDGQKLFLSSSYKIRRTSVVYKSQTGPTYLHI